MEDLVIHLPGGNRFDDMRIDLDSAFEYIKNLNSDNKISVRESKLKNKFRYYRDRILLKYNLQETFVSTGIRRYWFNEFRNFWSNILGGRPLTISDFLMLRFHYRIKFQSMAKNDWGDINSHLHNWTRPENIYLLFSCAYGSALNPFRNLGFLNPKRKYRILEYGCSHAPYFRSWRNYYNFMDISWTLADIKNYTSLFSYYSYKNIEEIENFIILDANNIHNPFINNDKKFDVIILTTVLEHVHNPSEVIHILTDNLQQKGILVFDYIKSDGIGLDSLQGLEGRKDALLFIKEKYDIISGDFKDLDRSIGLCIGVKK